MLRHLALTTAVFSVLVLAGCGSSSGSGTSNSAAATATLNTQEDAVDQGVSQATDAATESLVQQTTSDGVTATGTVITNAKLDLHRLSSAGTSVAISTLVDAGGHPLYPNLSGSFTITLGGGASISSWPTAQVTTAAYTVTVTFTGLTYTDPLSGAVATLTSGSLTFNFLGTYTPGSSAGNWTLTTETSTDVPTSAPLTWTISGAGGSSHTVTLTGYRHTLLDFTRTTSTGPATNTLVVQHTIDGNPLSGTTIPDGVIMPAGGTQLYTNWIHTVDGGTAAGGSQSTWNRYAGWTVNWNFGGIPITRTVTGFTETIYITRNGVVIKTSSLGLGATAGG